METIAELNQRFRIPGIAQVVAGQSGLPAVRVTTPEAAGEMYLHAAHVTAWKPQGHEEVLFVSRQSKFETGKAIRGGVPICCPWFGAKADDPKAPAHGLVRSKPWRLESIEKSGNAVVVAMSTMSDEDTRKHWPHDFRLVHRVAFGPTLTMELVMTNTGATPFRFEAALHTYFRIGDIAHARVHDLGGISYLDKTDGNKKKLQSGDVTIAKETDSVYLDTASAVELHDAAMRREIRIAKENSRTTVVWNPWAEKTKAMSDLGDDEWKQMLCIECANAGANAVDLAPGREHSMKAITTIAKA